MSVPFVLVMGRAGPQRLAFCGDRNRQSGDGQEDAGNTQGDPCLWADAEMANDGRPIGGRLLSFMVFPEPLTSDTRQYERAGAAAISKTSEDPQSQ